MKTPTVKLEPTVRGPIVGELVGQVVDVDGKTIQTRPVPGEACADGTDGAARNAAARISGSMRIRRLFKRKPNSLVSGVSIKIYLSLARDAFNIRQWRAIAGYD
jgi:hypothetical protein